MSAKEYLGDGVHAELELGGIKLTTEDGYGTTNTIILEPEVWGALLRWVASLRVTAREAEKEGTDR